MESLPKELETVGIKKFVETLKSLYIGHKYSYVYDSEYVYNLLLANGANFSELFLCCPTCYIDSNRETETSHIYEALLSVSIEHIESYLYKIPPTNKYLNILFKYCSKHINNSAIEKYCDKVFKKYQIPIVFDFDTSTMFVEYILQHFDCVPNYCQETENFESLLRYKNLYFYFETSEKLKFAETTLKTKFENIFNLFSRFTTATANWTKFGQNIKFESEYAYRLEVEKNLTSFGFTVTIEFAADGVVKEIDFIIPEIRLFDISTIEKIQNLFLSYLKHAETLLNVQI